MRASLPRVAVTVDKTQRYGRGVLQGLARYVETFGPWSLVIDPESHGRYGWEWLRDWRGDGMLVYVESTATARALLRSRRPVVDVYGHHRGLGLPVVANDEAAIGRLAADHLIERRLRRFGFVGYVDTPWSASREAAFAAALGERGMPCLVLRLPHRTRTLRGGDSSVDDLVAWLRTLTRPVGVMACSDRQAQRVLEACRRAGLAVPEEVAVLGVDNDEETCRLADPPLSSVTDNPEVVGFESARLLDDLMRSGATGRSMTTVLVPPLGVAARRSTDVLAVDDHLVARGLRLIHERACTGLGVDELAAALGASRTTVYRRFAAAVGRAPHREILRLQIDRARRLLLETDLSVEQVAERAGFRHPEYLAVVFRREVGCAPSELRRKALSVSIHAGGRS